MYAEEVASCSLVNNKKAENGNVRNFRCRNIYRYTCGGGGATKNMLIPDKHSRQAQGMKNEHLRRNIIMCSNSKDEITNLPTTNQQTIFMKNLMKLHNTYIFIQMHC